MKTDWRYYNHALLPACAPHEEVNTDAIINGEIWRNCNVGGYPLLARWTNDFDCGYETEWWYVIKDQPFDIDKIKAKRRWDIKKGISYFEVRYINSSEYAEQLADVQIAAFSAYPEKYRPVVDKEKTINGFKNDKIGKYYAAFKRDTGEMAAYVILHRNGNCLDLSVEKSKPQYEKLQVNAAMICGVLEAEKELLKTGYICDCERNVNHETAFPDYLIKYFGFRKAYCKLHMVYRPWFGFVIKCLYPFRKLLQKFDGIGLIHQANAVLKMEEIARSFK